jgi:CDGSH-type Zn-finger protein/uncharacterized Fe-S cluster protein YjdI
MDRSARPRQTRHGVQYKEKAVNEVKVYKGPGVSVQFNASRCIHAAECVHGLPTVFDPQARPWIQPGKATSDEVVAVVARCPTGALQATYEDGRAAETVSPRNELHIVADGPHHLRGDIEVRDDSGRVWARETRMALCRCGASGNKPYCDNSHVGSGFKDEGTCTPGEVVPLATGPLTLTLCTDGPVQCDGPVAIFDVFGEQATTVQQTWLCRCGASKNKPYCDGSHQAIGFRS